MISTNLMVLAELLFDGAVDFNNSDTGTAGKVLGQLLPDGRKFLTVTTPVHELEYLHLSTDSTYTLHACVKHLPGGVELDEGGTSGCHVCERVHC